MFDRPLSIAGAVADATDRVVVALLNRPWTILMLIALLVAFRSGLWWLLLVVAPAILFSEGSRQVTSAQHRNFARRRRPRSSDFSAPNLDVAGAPVLGAVALTAAALFIELPSPVLTVAMRVAVATPAAIILVGWRIGFVVFRPGRPVGAN